MTNYNKLFKGGAWLQGITVVLGGRWQPNDIFEKLRDDSRVNFVFTLISPQKKKELDESQVDDKPQITPFIFTSLIQLMSTYSLKEAETFTEETQKLAQKENLEKIMGDINAKKTQLSTLGNKVIYDETLSVIFSKSMTNKIIDALCNNKVEKRNGKIGVISAGMSEVDIVTLGYIYLTVLGYDAYPRVDLGVDNLRKTKTILAKINEFDIIIATAGMEAVLPIILGSITYKPIVAVPSSVSFGYGSEGYAGIQSIMNSSAPGIGIFNIGNIYGACAFSSCVCEYLTKRKQVKSVLGSPNTSVNTNRRSNIPGKVSRTNTTRVLANANNKQTLKARNNTTDKSKSLEKYKYLFNPNYTKTIDISGRQETIITEYSDIDISNAIRHSFKLIRSYNKTIEMVRNEVTAFQKLVFVNNINDKLDISTLGLREIYSDNKQSIHTNIDSRAIMARSECFDIKSKVLIICGGLSDVNYANELSAYLSLSGVNPDIIPSLNMNLPVLYPVELIKVFKNYEIFIIIAGGSGTISNIVGGFIGNKIVIAVPTHGDINTFTSMLNNCVGGIAVISPNNIYSAACLCLSILFKS